MRNTDKEKLQRVLTILSDLYSEDIFVLKDKIMAFNKVFSFKDGKLVDVTYISGVPSSFSSDILPDEGTKAL